MTEKFTLDDAPINFTLDDSPISFTVGDEPINFVLDAVASAAPSTDDWILATGFWNDNGFWRDSSFWID